MNTKIALVTGGNRGLGHNVVLHLARRGVDAILTYRSHAAEAEAAVGEVERLGARAVELPLDVADCSTFAGFAARVAALLGERWRRERFDFLVNNAGIGLHAGFADTTEAQFDQLLNVHFKGVFFLTQALLPLIADGGRIVNLSTGLTRFALPGYAAYAAMKGAVRGARPPRFSPRDGNHRPRTAGAGGFGAGATSACAARIPRSYPDRSPSS